MHIAHTPQYSYGTTTKSHSMIFVLLIALSLPSLMVASLKVERAIQLLTAGDHSATQESTLEQTHFETEQVTYADTSNVSLFVSTDPFTGVSSTITQPSPKTTRPPTDSPTISSPPQVTLEARVPKKIAPTVSADSPPATNKVVYKKNRLIGLQFYKEEYGAAVVQYNEWKDSQPVNAQLIKKIANQPIGSWIGAWTDEAYIQSKMNIAASKGTTPIWILYHIPGLNCGSGGFASAAAYKTWINQISRGVANGSAVIIVEPDALAMITCLSGSKQTERYQLIKYAVDRFKNNNPKAIVYIDAGHGNWVGADTMAQRLQKAGVANAQGFSLNISNFGHTSINTSYGNTLGKKLNNAHYVIDTSRNGNGPAPDNEWCNPPGRALGARPSIDSTTPLRDGLLWLKYPGESDEPCNGGPAAGVWWPEYALELAKNASW